MATIMSGFGFQDVMASIGPQTNVSSGVQRKISRNESIHSGQTVLSGHFMVSEIEESEQTVEEESIEPNHESDYERPVESIDPSIKYDLETECSETTQTYVYGPKASNSVSIDGSLTKLFETMSLAYSGKITSPRWKTFKGLKLKLKDKIRLNNIIWRAWHIQYIAGRNPIVCQFSSPVDSDRHKKVEAVILEGKYWKRRLATVTAEYQKWRLYYTHIGKPPTTPFQTAYTRPRNFEWENYTTTFNTTCDYTEDYSMDFTDSLFSQLLQPNLIDFPNPREIARSGMGAQFIQPGLVQLQPNLDDFMDTFEPLQELFFNSRNMSSLPTLPEETNVENSNLNIVSQNPKLCQTISGISTPDLLNSLLCQTTTSNSTPIQDFSVDNNIQMKSLNESIGQNRNQMSPELHLSYKSNSIEAMQPVIQPLAQTLPLPEATVQTMSAMNDLTAIQTKPMQDSMYNQFSPSVLVTQSSVPLPQSHSGAHSKSRAPGACDFAQSDNSSYTSPTQAYGLKKYVNSCPIPTLSPDPNAQSFVVPKSLPIKQRSRERSISTPHINRDNSALQGLSSMAPPVAAVSLIDIHSSGSAQNVERSSSLPIYTQERRKSVASMHRNAAISTSALSHNISYPSQPSLQPQNPKLQLSGQTAMGSNIVPSHPPYGSAQFFGSNPYNTSQGSSAGSTLIARLLTSNSLNNISNESSQQFYSNQIAAQNQKLANSATDRPTTIDATCIGIRAPVTTSANDKFLFAHEFGDQSISPMSGQLSPNLKQTFVMQSNANPIQSSVRSPPSGHQMASLVKSRSSPVRHSSPKDSFHSTPSPPSICSPTRQPAKSKSVKERIQYKEHRRVCHINAEQKRRCNIKNGFDTLRSLLPSISQNTNTKISKAAMLQKAAQHIHSLKEERQSQQEECNHLRQQVESLNQTIGVFQNQLPVTGVPISSQRSTQTRELYENYVKERTLQNWKFWIFSIIMESLWDSYNQTVATSNGEEMSKTLFRWLEQNCCLTRLRRDVLNSLCYLSTSTNILTNPKSLPDEAVLAVTKKEKRLSS